MKNLPIAMILAISTLAGCGAPNEGLDETIASEGFAALTTTQFTLRNYQTGLCMGVAAGTPTFGTPFVTWRCDGSTNQRFQRDGLIGDGYYRLWNQVGWNRCVHTDQFTNGSQIKIRSCISQLDNNLGWKPIYAGTNLDNRECYRFENYGAQGKVFGASGGNTAPGTPVILWSNFNNQYTHPDQLWCVYPT